MKQTEEKFHKALEQLGPFLIQAVKEGAAMAGKDTSGITNVTINGKNIFRITYNMTYYEEK